MLSMFISCWPPCGQRGRGEPVTVSRTAETADTFIGTHCHRWSVLTCSNNNHAFASLTARPWASLISIMCNFSSEINSLIYEATNQVDRKCELTSWNLESSDINSKQQEQNELFWQTTLKLIFFVILSGFIKITESKLGRLWERHWFKHFSVYIRQCLYIRSIVSLHKMHNITVAVVAVVVVDKWAHLSVVAGMVRIL